MREVNLKMTLPRKIKDRMLQNAQNELGLFPKSIESRIEESLTKQRYDPIENAFPPKKKKTKVKKPKEKKEVSIWHEIARRNDPPGSDGGRFNQPPAQERPAGKPHIHMRNTGRKR